MVNYHQTVPKLHISINILMKKHHNLTENKVPAILSECMDQMPPPILNSTVVEHSTHNPKGEGLNRAREY
jgi:hypothetical protein